MQPTVDQVLPGSATTDYENYLKTDALLALQPTPDSWAHRDELLFTVVHQSAELWLKLAVAEVEQAITQLDMGKRLAAARSLDRVVECIDIITPPLHMLERMTPWDYQHVRTALGHGSGFDSPGFLRLRTALPNLVAAVRRQLESDGLTLRELYLAVEHNEELFAIVERLVEVDEGLMKWRALHTKVIERTIGGTVEGTQGTPVEIVRNLRDKSIMDELWTVRADLTELADQTLR